MAFSHLHVHSEFSALDGFGKIEEYLEKAKVLGQPALAITDHGNCSGLYQLSQLASRYGIKPIFGCEFYFRNGEEDKNNHLVLLAKDNDGLKNIFKLHEHAHVYGYNRRPTINETVLRKYSKGIICLSACLANIIPRSITEGEYDKALKWAKTFKQIFNEDFYLEIQSRQEHEQMLANMGIVKLAKRLDIKTVATNDVHYTEKEDFEVHDTLLCMQTNSKKSAEKRFRFDGNYYWFKSEDEMVFTELTPQDRLDALNNTQEIVDKCNATIVKGNYLPKYYNVPDGMTEEQLLREQVTSKYKTVIQDNGLHSQAYVDAVKHELDVIKETGYCGYHLIVSDFVEHARKINMLVGDGRGSGAGCKVAYILGITKIEPTEHNLLFERFLDYGRQPDYDIDFADNNAIFSYLQKRYGVGNVARIVAFGTLSAKAVIRKVLSVYDTPEYIISQISGSIPAEPKMTLAKAYAISPDLVSFKRQYPKQFAEAERLEGRISHTSQHAGGIVIYPNLGELVPLMSDSEDRSKRVVAWDKKMAEDFGLCKIDCLGLEALTTLDETIKSIKRVEGIDIDIYNIDYNDPLIYNDLCKGDVSGIFQLENQRDVVAKQKPSCFNDIVTLSSIIRPGTCDINEYFQRRLSKNYTIPEEQKAYMEESEGLIIYQEQYELLAQTYAGWKIGFSDKYIRKNKGLRDDAELENKFITDCDVRGYNYDTAKTIWELIVSVASGGYGFNKSHSVSYSVITYRMAWLKHYYPKHFYASLLTKLYHDDKKKHLLPNVIAECKQRNIAILPPDINLSEGNFIPNKDGIRFAITSVKGLGASALAHLYELRPIQSLEDMIQRATRKFLRENVVDSLIKAGCFDEQGKTRYEILLSYKAFIKSKKEVEQKVDMDYEYEALNIYLSKHPMEQWHFKSLYDFNDDSECLIAGIVKKVEEKFDKKGNKMAFINIESQYGVITCLAFGSYWANVAERQKYSDSAIVMIKGKRSGNSCIIWETNIIQIA